jgi:glycosyltransferase involved in cell wall biosynthesis
VRICFFNRSYYPDLGATGQLLTELAEDLVSDYESKVSVVAGPPLVRGTGFQSRDYVPFRMEVHRGVEIFRAAATTFRPGRFAGRAANYLSYFLSACLVGLRVPRPDVVVSLTDPPIIGLAARLAARRSGARFVFWCQDIFPEVARVLEDFQSGMVNRFLDRVNRLLIRKADRVVALGETMRERLIAEKGAEPEKVTVIHNWADCSAIVPGPKRNPFSVSHGLVGPFVVMHSGNVGLSQGLDTLLGAADRLRHCHDLVVVVVGDGAKRKHLEVRARALGLSNNRFLPYQPKDGLRDSFASADVFVVSLRPGLAGYIVPSKLYGILAAGRPYVAAVEEACEVAAITKKYDCGLLARPEDPQDLAEKILTLYHDPELARRLGANARQAALAFDRPLQVRAYYNLFHEVVRTRFPTPPPAAHS